MDYDSSYSTLDTEPEVSEPEVSEGEEGDPIQIPPELTDAELDILASEPVKVRLCKRQVRRLYNGTLTRKNVTYVPPPPPDDF